MGFFNNVKENASLNHDEKIKRELTACSSLNEMFKVLDKYYDLDKKISPMLKPTAVHQITKNIKTITTVLSIKER